MSGQELPPYVVGTPLVTLPLCAGPGGSSPHHRAGRADHAAVPLTRVRKIGTPGPLSCSM
jgi:hypothetical protein